MLVDPPPLLTAEFEFGLLTLTGAEDSDETLIVKTGLDYTDVFLNGQFFLREPFAQQDTLTTILFDGLTGTDSLTFIGQTPVITVILVDVEQLQLNCRDAVVESSAAVAFAASSVNGPLDVTTTDGDVTQTGRLSVSGTVTITAADGAANILLTSPSNLFGTLILTGADVSIQEAASTELGPSTIGNLTVKSGSAITDSGKLTVAGDLTLTSNRNVITLDDPASTFDGTMHLKGTKIAVTNDTDTDLGTITATGTFTLISSGAITHEESLNLTLSGLATMTAGGDTPDITLVNGTNNFASLSLFGRDVTVSEASATDLFTTDATNLTVNSKGAISDSGILTVSEATSLIAVGRPITLNHPASKFEGVVTLSGTNLDLVNNTATILGTVVASGRWNLTSAGDVTQSAATTTVVGRVTIVAADQNISLGTGSRFGSISVFGKDVILDEANATNLFTSTMTGDFTLTSAGPVTDSGDLHISGTTTIDAGNRAITLDSNGSHFDGTVSSIGTSVTLKNGIATDLGTTIATGNLRVTSGGDVTQSGTLRVTGRATFIATEQNITLDDSDNRFGAISLFGQEIKVNELDATNLYTSTATGSFTLQSGGRITDSGPLTVLDGLTTLIALGGSPNDITLDSTATAFGGSVILIGLNLSLRCNSSLDLGFVEAAGTLTIIARGDITDSNPTNVPPSSPVLAAEGTVFIRASGLLSLDEDRAFTAASVTLVGDAGTSV